MRNTIRIKDFFKKVLIGSKTTGVVPWVMLI